MNNNKVADQARQSLEKSITAMQTEFPNPSSLSEAVQSNGLMQTKTQYSTAVQVIRPRNLNAVIQRCLEEAAIAGDEFYYAWKQGDDIIEGPTVGAALAIARNWGNCAVDCRVEETSGTYIFYGAFIDLETGFNLIRPFQQNKQSPKNKKGEYIYKGERGRDIVFQIGASKGIRNAVLNGVPKWLTTKVMSKAKENVADKIQKMGIEKARGMIIKKATNLGIPIERIEALYSKSPSWDIEKLVMLSGALRSIEEGYESVEALFPIEEESKQQTVSKLKKLPESPEENKPDVEPENIIVLGEKVQDQEGSNELFDGEKSPEENQETKKKIRKPKGS